MKGRRLSNLPLEIYVDIKFWKEIKRNIKFFFFITDKINKEIEK